MTAQADSDPLLEVAKLAESAALQRGHSLMGSELRLFHDRVIDVAPANEPVSPFALGRAYELLLAPSTRRRTGSHLTPESVARDLAAMMPAPDPSDRVLDPAAGGAELPGTSASGSGLADT